MVKKSSRSALLSRQYIILLIFIKEIFRALPSRWQIKFYLIFWLFSIIKIAPHLSAKQTSSPKGEGKMWCVSTKNQFVACNFLHEIIKCKKIKRSFGLCPQDDKLNFIWFFVFLVLLKLPLICLQSRHLLPKEKGRCDAYPQKIRQKYLSPAGEKRIC